MDAYDAKNRAAAERTSVSHDVEEWKMQVNAFRINAYGELLKIASGNGYPRTWADGFFRSEPNTAESAQDDETDVAGRPDPAVQSLQAAV